MIKDEKAGTATATATTTAPNTAPNTATATDSKAKKLEFSDLETATTPTEEKTKIKKEVTPEEVTLIEKSGAKLIELGISPELTKLLPLLTVWHDKTLSTPVKETVIANFGGSESLKTFATEKMGDEILSLQGIQKALSILNNIKAFYARREGTTGKVKIALMQITISNKSYTISKDLYASFGPEVSRDEKVKQILAHPLTVENPAIEILL